ncbi:MAG: DUF4255 domain-containing protein, partial [Proteobacteria bacterium]|nr:DUF4255 domain-containing protein [Pseudomonadota bacterium]
PAMDIIPGARVTTVRPDTLGQGNQTRGVNLFLYRIVPNVDYRNMDTPTRYIDGSLATVPTIAVNLHYLLTAYGDESHLESQLLLGAAIARLHKSPVLAGELVEKSVAQYEAMVGGSDLAEQKPRLEVLFESLSDDTLSKIWSMMFQTPYRLSVSYCCKPLFLQPDADVPPRAAPGDIAFDMGGT